MSFSLILSNSLFGSLSILVILYLLNKPALLIYKKGILIFSVIILVIFKLLLPYEFFLLDH